ncbi:hypothetical protein AKJ38_02110 [candidate division MSBL1 archaeon SCGC-AAA259I14]|uniref:Helicase HerA central domain-containing protein n=1 Tax=candidate division MSBL1 archaeon SCGC-AAA259I14 TaxID=1698268 RepID=A0A133USC3_9EURY|nr:hypothetical protein AKJ38_02110 [candidate division MSBL1 archaeon SCGC-AAA259I14]
MMVVGRAIGPGETENELIFVTTTIDEVRVGEFVYYETNEKHSLCRVMSREEIQVFPDTFLDSREYTPKQIASALGVTEEENVERYKVKAKILGTFTEEDGEFKNLRLPPEPGTPIFRAENDYLEKVLYPSREQGVLEVGSLLNREVEEVKIKLDMNEIVTKHLSILASTGSGKSYTVGVLLEELVKSNNRGSGIVVDVHGEYDTLAQDSEIGKYFEIYEPKIKIKNMTVETFNLASPRSLTGKMKNRLYQVLERLKKKANYGFNEILEELDEEDQTEAGIRWRINSIKNYGIFDKSIETSIDDICQPGKFSILQFPQASEIEEKIALSYFARKILEARKNYKKIQMGKKLPKKAETINFPVVIILEEAHNYAPANQDVPTRDLLRSIAREGRKFGVGLCVVTQRPSRLDEDVLSQCNSNIIMKIKNEADQNSIRKGVEAASEDLIRDLPGLTPGQAIIAGECLNTPVLVSIRKRKSEHGGTTPNVAEESRMAYEKSMEEQRRADSEMEEVDKEVL